MVKCYNQTFAIKIENNIDLKPMIINIPNDFSHKIFSARFKIFDSNWLIFKIKNVSLPVEIHHIVQQEVLLEQILGRKVAAVLEDSWRDAVLS